MASIPRFGRLNTLKQPGGEELVVVDWAGDNAVAATSGNESSFAMSSDDGYAFNDLSLIDTAITALNDVAPSADGKKVYMTSRDAANDVSVWLKSSSWKRVFSGLGVTGATPPFQVRIAPDDDTAVYIAAVDSQNIWMSKDSGEIKWKHVPCYKLSATVGVQDFVVESADVVYAIDTAGCSKTVNGGASWSIKEPLDGLSAGTTIALAPNNDILVGGNAGDVAFSTDGGESFTRVVDTTDADTVWIVADKDYADNGMVYIVAGDEVERGKLSRTVTWASREHDDFCNTGTWAPTGIAQYEGVVYVMTSDGADSRLWRALNLKSGATGELCEWGYRQTTYEYEAAPHSFKISPDYKAGQVKVWAIDTANDLHSFVDPIALEGPTLKAPEGEASVAVNLETGQSQNVAFTWERYHNKYITGCALEIATDAEFDGIIYEQEFLGITTDVIAEVIGPTGSTTTESVDMITTGTKTELVWIDADGDGIVDAGEYVEMEVDYEETIPDGLTTTTYRMVNFMPGETYYWRVRVSDVGGNPLISPWSEGRSFTVAPLITFNLLSPADGEANVPVQPVFVWSEYTGAIGYEIALCEDPSFEIIEWSRGVDDTFYKPEEALAYSTTYYWRVRGVTGEAPPKKAAPGGPWVKGVFTTEAKAAPPAEPIVIEPTETITKIEKVEVPVPQPAPIPDYLLWTIIGIGAVLVIALIVLIVRTRRVA
jgi:hypothetical protein